MNYPNCIHCAQFLQTQTIHANRLCVLKQMKMSVGLNYSSSCSIIVSSIKNESNTTLTFPASNGLRQASPHFVMLHLWSNLMKSEVLDATLLEGNVSPAGYYDTRMWFISIFEWKNSVDSPDISKPKSTVARTPTMFNLPKLASVISPLAWISTQMSAMERPTFPMTTR